MAIFRNYRCDEVRCARMLRENLGYHGAATCLFGSG